MPSRRFMKRRLKEHDASSDSMNEAAGMEKDPSLRSNLHEDGSILMDWRLELRLLLRSLDERP